MSTYHLVEHQVSGGQQDVCTDVIVYLRGSRLKGKDWSGGSNLSSNPGSATNTVYLRQVLSPLWSQLLHL